MDLSDVKGHENIKRSIEIALAGNHYLLIFGNHGQGATTILKSALEMDINVQVYDNTIVIPRKNLNDKGATIVTMKYCPCGNYKSDIRECTCSVMEIKEHLRHLDHTNIEIYSEMSELTFEQLTDTRPGESSEVIMSRVKNARQSDIRQDLDTTSISLLKTAYVNLYMTPKMYHAVLAVSKTIAALSNSDTIQDVHVAEAISYRRKKL